MIPLDRWLRRRRIIGATGVLAAAVVVAAALLRPPGVLSEVDALDRRPAVVLDVIDGRTLRVRGSGGTEHVVRLVGLTIEDAKADAARAALFKAVADKPVTLTFEIDTLTDDAGTLLAYVYAHDGQLLNEWLIEQRLARADGSPHAVTDWFTRLDRRVNKK